MANDFNSSVPLDEGTEDTLIPAMGSANTLIPPPKPSATATLAIPGGAPGNAAAPGRTTQARTTVLPSYSEAGLVHRERDRYQVMEVLGRGGMGEVSLAKDHDIDRPVAVKYLHAQLAEPALVARFVEEIRTVGHLEHPNIVPIHDVGLDEQGRYFFVMKHLEGETLEQIIEKLRARDPAYEARFTFERRAEIVIGVLNALEFAHSKGIVHRDIKPANVMVGKHGEVVLMDWGIAKTQGSTIPALPSPSSPASGGRLVQTQYGSILGTPLYMSPEQAAGKTDAIDARSDLYSVAVLLLELMSLEHYLGEPTDLAAILSGVQTAMPKQKLWEYTRYPVFPAPYLYVAYQGMAKDPAQRFQSAQEMLSQLRLALDGQYDVHCRVTFMRRMSFEAGRFVDRSPGRAMFASVTAAGFVLTTTAISAMTVWHWLVP